MFTGETLTPYDINPQLTLFFCSAFSLNQMSRKMAYIKRKHTIAGLYEVTWFQKKYVEPTRV